MWSWWWVVLCVAIWLQTTETTDQVHVVQSKGLQIAALPNVIVATELIQLKFTANLPSMSAIPKSDFVICDDIKGNRKTCEAIDSLHSISSKIIQELSKIFSKLGPVTRRQKRSLLPFLGHLRHYIEGTVTDDQLNDVIQNLNNLGEDVQAIRNKTTDLISVTNTHAIQIQGLSKNMQEMLDKFSHAYNVLVEGLSAAQTDDDIMFHKLAMSVQLQSTIELLQNHLIAMKTVYHSCQAGVLDRLAVGEDDLQKILEQKNVLLNAGDLTLAIPQNHVELYYLLKTAQCHLVNQTTIEIDFNVPIKETNRKWGIFSIKPLKFLLDSQTCSILDENIVIASDGESVRPIDELDKLGSTFVKILPRLSKNKGISDCLHKILTGMEVGELQEFCHLNCVNSKESVIQEIDSNKYSVLNPGSQLNVICHNQVKTTVSKLVSGRHEIFLPCHCSLTEESSTQRILIPNGAACVLPQGVEEQVRIDNSWTEIGNFSLLEVFVSSDHALKLMSENVTLPPLNVATIAPMSSTGKWKPLPLFSSGWIETIILVLISAGTICGIAYYFEQKTSFLSLLWKCGTSAYGCMTRKNKVNENSNNRDNRNDSIDGEDIELQRFRQRAAARL